MNEQQADVPQEFILVTGELVFHEKDKPDTLNAVRCNGMLMQDTRNIGVYSLGKAQQVLQANFLKKIPPQDAPTVVDVVITNISFLGRMTKEEFQHQPAQLQERTRVPTPGDALYKAVQSAGVGDNNG